MTVATTDPVQVFTTCLQQTRDSIPTLGDDEMLDCLRQVEAASRMAHSLVLDLVAETEARNLAGTAGFGTTKRLLAGMLSLSKADEEDPAPAAGALRLRDRRDGGLGLEGHLTGGRRTSVQTCPITAT